MDVSQAAADHSEEGQQLLKQGKSEDAIKEFSSVISIQSNSEAAYRGRAKAYRQLGQRRHAAANTDAANRIARSRPRGARGVIIGAHAFSLMALGLLFIGFAFPMGVYAAELYERAWSTAVRLIIVAVCLSTTGIVLALIGIFKWLKQLIPR